MPSALTSAHIEGERRLREIVRATLQRQWRSLPAYNEADVEEWLRLCLPVIRSATRQSVTFTGAYLSRFLGELPRPINVEEILRNLRQGVTDEEVYRRPFVTVWTALSEGRSVEEAIQAGESRALSMAATDVQLAMRDTLQPIGAESGIVGYQRVADPDCCDFCAEVDGAFLRSDDPMPLHNGCGCSVEPVEGERPRRSSPPPKTVAVHNHGELGPVLADPADHFTGPAQI